MLEEILHRSFYKAETIFAGGQKANNKIDAEKLRDDKRFSRRVSHAVGRLAARFSPDMLVAVPNGGNWLAIDIAHELGTAVVLLDKDSQTARVSYRQDGQEQIETSSRLVVVEDIFNRFTNTNKVLDLPGVLERTVGAVAIIDRGIPEERGELPVPAAAMYHIPIPSNLGCDSPLWEYAERSELS